MSRILKLTQSQLDALPLAVLLFLGGLASLAPARVVLDKPIDIRLQKLDHTTLHGRAVAWDESGFDFTPDSGKPGRVSWSELDAHAIFLVRGLIAGSKDGSSWVDIGRDLLGVPDGKQWADKAFERALQIDPKLHDRVEALRHPPAPGTPASQPSGPSSGAAGGTVNDSTANPSSAAPDSGSPNSASSPRVVGVSDQQFWGKLSDEDQAATLERLRKFAENAQAKLQRPLKTQETKYFLFCSDLPAGDTARWTGLLDKMYARLAELFGVPRGQNLWRGKALIFVFSSADDYRKFAQDVQNTDPGQSAGMTHCFGDGVVTIAFYRQPDEALFAHVLVHESVHGFVHRFRSPVSVPSWANEGLAETIASELVPDAHRAKSTPALAHRMLVLHGGKLGEFFTEAHIEGWHYSIAETLTSWMIQRNKRGYVDFINGIKQGQSWQESLEKNFKMPLPALLTGYSQAMGTSVTEH